MSQLHNVASGSGKDRFRLLKDFIRQRHMAYLHRTGQATAPPTDQILREYRFTNLKRSLDRGTIDIIKWLEDMPRAYLPFYVLVARIINSAEILYEYEPAMSMGYNATRMLALMNRRLEQRKPIRSNAYMMTTHGSATAWPVFYAEGVLRNAWASRGDWMWEDGLPELTCAHYGARLERLHGVGSFLAGQVIADLKILKTPMRDFRDAHTFCLSGPGSRRGVKHVDWPDGLTWHDKIGLVCDIVNVELRDMNAHYRVDHQDAQNVMCEFDKYVRVLHGKPYRRRL